MVSTYSAAPGRLLTGGRFSFGPLADLEMELERGNSHLIWGWKRDVENASRVVYFGGELEADGGEVVLSRWYLFYRHRAQAESITRIAAELKNNQQLKPFLTSFRLTPSAEKQLDLRLELGVPDRADLDRVRRLQLRKPRRRFAQIVMPPALPLAGATDLLPADIYVGSGLSYEAGLPTLCDMHLAFGVDNEACTQFAVGDEDMLPARLTSDLADAIGSFCAVHVGALKAMPTPSMLAIAELKKAGLIGKVFTDNVDNMLAKVGVPFERTRGSGVFNELYPAEFASRRLIVIGVAADRRSLVKQARAKGLEIVTVNPCEKVAPMVRHLDYIRPSDPFFKVTADTFFKHVMPQAMATETQAAA